VQLQSIIHHVTNKQLASKHPEAQVAIIGVEAHKPIIQALCLLHIHRHTTPVLYSECSEKEVNALINVCLKRNLVVIVVGNAPFAPAGDEPFSATVVAPSANVKTQEPYKSILTVPQLDIFSAIGFQTYHTDADDIAWMDEHFYEMLRLGAFREQQSLAEPLFRESHHVFFDLNALRASDAPETKNPSPNGLYAEELCQLAAFAGRSPKLQTFRLFGYTPTLTTQTLTAQTSAQVLWHLLEGITVRNQTTISSPQTSVNAPTGAHVKRIIVDMGKNGQTLEFINDTLTGFWWLQIPLANGGNRVVACLPDDYQCACRQEIPERWVRYFQKFNNG